MKVFEYAKEHGLSNSEVKEKFGLTSHLSIIQEMDQAEISTIPEIVAVKEEIKPFGLPEGLTIEQLQAEIRGLGSKSKFYKYLPFITIKAG